jgi:hypothetical protein
MLFLVHDPKPHLLINVPGCEKNTLCPERHLLIPRLPRVSDAFLNQPFANSEPTGFRFHMQQPQPGDFVRCLPDKDSANS